MIIDGKTKKMDIEMLKNYRSECCELMLQHIDVMVEENIDASYSKFEKPCFLLADDPKSLLKAI